MLCRSLFYRASRSLSSPRRLFSTSQSQSPFAKKLSAEHKISPEMIAKVEATLKSASMPATPSTLAALGKAGVEALIGSISVEEEDEEVNACADPALDAYFTLKVTLPTQRTPVEVKMLYGENLHRLSQTPRGLVLNEVLECACGGIMSCSTCHVYVDDRRVYEVLLGGRSEAEEGEQDMLDLAWGFEEGRSRLGCNLKVHKHYTWLLIDFMRNDVSRLTHANNNYGWRSYDISSSSSLLSSV